MYTRTTKWKLIMELMKPCQGSIEQLYKGTNYIIRLIKFCKGFSKTSWSPYNQWIELNQRAN